MSTQGALDSRPTYVHYNKYYYGYGYNYDYYYYYN